MIFYFSGTGNTRFVAEQIAVGIGEELVFIPDAIRDKKYEYTIAEGETLGFCFPTHGWQPPRIIREFIRKLKINAEYCWAVTTCGDNMGETMTILNKELATIGLKTSAVFSVIMPESYVCLPFMYTDTEEKEREKNYQVKLAIIEELKELIESPEDPNKNYNEFKKLQQQWHEVTLIPQNKANELWKSYQLYVEKFYDLLKLNNEFREYDFKKNLEIKTKLCEAAEKLVEEEDVVAAFHHLQKLHQEYRDTGPVAKELRDEIWARFKAASTLLNKKHQQYFETQKEAEQDNLDKKTVICEIVEGIDYGKLNGFQAWDKKTQEVIALQNKWKTIGYAPQKLNVKIFERFRSACDEFFKKKSEYFKAAKARMNENLEKKRALVERAEALKDSKEWKETAEELVKIQKEWKSIGPVAKRYSDTLWKRFIAACDYFFEQKGAATSSQRSIESENLKRKKAIIEELKELLNKEESEENNQQIHKLMTEWNEVGHVPFKEKDKVYEQYRAMVDKLYKTFNLSAASKKVSKFRAAVSKVQETGIQAVYREREKLVRNYENLLNELHTYENNLGFLNATSKSGNSLLTELTKKMDKLKAEIEVAKEKIRHIDEDIQQEDEKAE